MKNNQIKEFYILRSELVKNSCKETLKKSNEYQKYIEKHSEDKHILINPSIRQRVLEDLEADDFIMDEKGTQYLATLITMYYHERKLFRRKDIEAKGYFDLSLKNNAHYSMLGTTPIKAKEEMNKSIEHSNAGFITIEELAYETADNYIHRLREPGDEKNVSYSKKLLKK